LEDQQHAEGVLGGEPVLVLGEKLYAIGEQCGGLRPRHLAGVARIVVPAQLDRAPRRYPQRFDEIGNEAKTLVHPLTMPIPTSPGSPCDDQYRMGRCSSVRTRICLARRALTGQTSRVAARSSSTISTTSPGDVVLLHCPVRLGRV